jgi:hypothetical protein
MSARNPSAEVLPFLGTELAALAGRVAQVETLVSHLSSGGRPGGSTVIALQDLDLLRQTLDDLARLAVSASGTDSAGAEHLALCLRLETVRNRFLGRTPGPVSCGDEAFEALALAPPVPST